MTESEEELKSLLMKVKEENKKVGFNLNIQETKTMASFPIQLSSHQFRSVCQSYPTLCDPMNHSTPGFPVHYKLRELTQTHVLWVGDTIQPISASVVPFFSCLQSFPASGSFQAGQYFALGGQSIGVSASTLVLQKNIQDWFPLPWTGLISFQSNGLSRVFSNTTVQQHQQLGTQLSL